MATPRPREPPRPFKRRTRQEEERSAPDQPWPVNPESALELSESEQEEVERRASLRVVVVHEAIRKEGEIGVESYDSGVFVPHLLRGIFAGWLIALMVWLLPSAGSSRMSVIVAVTYVVGLARLSHVIAGSVEVLYLVVTGHLPVAAFLGQYLAPTLVGNMIGGVSLVAALNHAQVVAGLPGPR